MAGISPKDLGDVGRRERREAARAAEELTDRHTPRVREVGEPSREPIVQRQVAVLDRA
jgi:hypothetical protein